MASANTIDISEFQDPSTFDYQAAKNAGIKTIIIRGSVSMRLDKHAKEHIANAKKYGFHWHLYHYYYGGSGEANYAVQAAQELGLSSSQYLFLDMEDSSLPTDWATPFEAFRQKAKSHFKVGLYCSDSPYQAKFNDTTLKQEGVARWVASYSYEPKNYDIWQMSGAGSGGFGTYTGDVDRDYDKAGVLTSNSSSDQPKTPTGPANPGYRAIILEDGIDTDAGIYGRGCSYDNGKTFKVYWTPFGRKYYQEDADHLYPFFKKYLGICQVPWSSITDKPDLALKSDIPSTIDWSKVTNKPDIATQDDLKKIELTPGPQGERGHSAWTSTAKWSSSTDTVTDAWITDLQGISKDSLPEVGDLIIGSTGLVRLVTSVSLDGSDHFGSFNAGTSLYSLQGPKGDTPDVDMSKYATIESVNSLFSEVATLNQSKSITSGTLSDLASGKYEVDFVATDAPVQVEGMLRVDTGTKYKVQTFTAMQANNSANCRIGDQYTRAYDGSTWSAWHKVTQWP